MAEAQRKAEVEPDTMADDLDKEAMAMAETVGGAHRLSMLDQPSEYASAVV